MTTPHLRQLAQRQRAIKAELDLVRTGMTIEVVRLVDQNAILARWHEFVATRGAHEAEEARLDAFTDRVLQAHTQVSYGMENMLRIFHPSNYATLSRGNQMDVAACTGHAMSRDTYALRDDPIVQGVRARLTARAAPFRQLIASEADAYKAVEVEFVRLQGHAVVQHLPVDALVHLVGAYTSEHTPFADGSSAKEDEEEEDAAM